MRGVTTGEAVHCTPLPFAVGGGGKCLSCPVCVKIIAGHHQAGV